MDGFFDLGSDERGHGVANASNPLGFVPVGFPDFPPTIPVFQSFGTVQQGPASRQEMADHAVLYDFR